ncbi:MAG: hypothetical protein H6554_03995 [Chitinophagales bacterium]|nr:hypothetical protein [Chitinophagales bacterium]
MSAILDRPDAVKSNESPSHIGIGLVIAVIVGQDVQSQATTCGFGVLTS